MRERIMVRLMFVWVACLVSLSLPVSGILIGCGHSGNSLGPDASTSDGGVASNVVGADGGEDTTTGNEADASFGDGGIACIEGGAGPKGTQLVSSATVSIVGVTDDNQVVYVQTSSNTLLAVPALGGAPTQIGATEGSVAVASKAVFNWTGVNQDGTIGTGLQVWTTAHGSQSLATASLVWPADSSADGSRVLYFDNTTASTANLFVAGTDGTGKTKLASSVFWTQDCVPQVVFVGTSALLGNCTAPPPATGGPAPVGTLTLFVGASGTGTVLSSTALLSFQTSGTSILFNDTRGLVLADATSGSTTVVDAAGTSPTFTKDGTTVVYVTNNDGFIEASLRRVAEPDDAGRRGWLCRGVGGFP